MSAPHQQLSPHFSEPVADSAAAASNLAGSDRPAPRSTGPSASIEEHAPRSTMSVAETATPSSVVSAMQCDSPPSAAASSAVTTAAPFTRWSALYDDALHSIFKFASLLELARLMSVSRRWSEVVMVMPPSGLRCVVRDFAYLNALFTSRLRRHIAALLDPIDSTRSFTIDQIGLLERVSVALPGLTSLHATPFSEVPIDELLSGLSESFGMAPIASAVGHAPFVSCVEGTPRLCNALRRFRNLRQMHLDLFSFDPDLSDSLNRIIETIGEISSLQWLKLLLPIETDETSYAPLAALLELRSFIFAFEDWEVGGIGMLLSNDQIRQLRAMTSLEQLVTPFVGQPPTEFLVRLLQPGHAMKLTTLGTVGYPVLITEPLAAALDTLPTLTELHAQLQCSDVQFLSQLRRFTHVNLEGAALADPSGLVSALRHCSQISELRLSQYALNGRQMEELLPALHLLSGLTLHALPQLDSLRCLSTPALASSLKKLVLSSLPLCPPTEIAHLFGLRSLEFVDVAGWRRL